MANRPFPAQARSSGPTAHTRAQHPLPTSWADFLLIRNPHAARLIQFLKRNMPAKAWRVQPGCLRLYLKQPRTCRQALLHMSTHCVPVLLPSCSPDRPVPSGLSDLNSASPSQQVPSTLINLTVCPPLPGSLHDLPPAQLCTHVPTLSACHSEHPAAIALHETPCPPFLLLTNSRRLDDLGEFFVIPIQSWVSAPNFLLSQHLCSLLNKQPTFAER